MKPFGCYFPENHPRSSHGRELEMPEGNRVLKRSKIIQMVKMNEPFECRSKRFQIGTVGQTGDYLFKLSDGDFLALPAWLIEEFFEDASD